jgi:DNA mismatch endonuclease (patch repair protein)
MRRVRAKDTSPELALRRALWRRGLRFRVHDTALPGKPDIVFRRAKLAVFVDGDFWHGRQWLDRGFASLEEQMSRVNRPEYWIPKLARNLERDRATNEALRGEGWRVHRVWESQLRESADDVAAEIEGLISGT